jgi:hypothetical protein
VIVEGYTMNKQSEKRGSRVRPCPPGAGTAPRGRSSGASLAVVAQVAVASKV